MRCEDVQGRPKRSRSFKVKFSHLEREKPSKYAGCRADVQDVQGISSFYLER